VRDKEQDNFETLNTLIKSNFDSTNENIDQKYQFLSSKQSEQHKTALSLSMRLTDLETIMPTRINKEIVLHMAAEIERKLRVLVHDTNQQCVSKISHQCTQALQACTD
jgi:hypothetical protein